MIPVHERHISRKSAALSLLIPGTEPVAMGRSIMETVVQSNGMPPRPQMLRGPERGQPYPASSPGSDTFQLMTYDTRFPVKTSTRDVACGLSAQIQQPTSPVSSPVATRRGSHDFDTTTSFPQDDVISNARSGHVSGSNSDSSTNVVSSDLAEPTSPASSAGSESTERPPPVSDVQLVEDDPIYSIGPVKVFNKIQRSIEPRYEARWEIIYPDVFDRVLSKLRRRRFGMRSSRPRALPNIQLMSAGMTRDTSTPAVVVVIHKHIKTMQEFLNKDSVVQNLCKPGDGATVELEVLACKGHSALIGKPNETLRIDTIFSSDSDSDYVSDDEDSIISADDSDDGAVDDSMELDADFMSVILEESHVLGDKHGLGIRLVTKDGLRYVRGTCGGVLRLETPYHPPRQVGLLAGHLLEQLGRISSEAAHEAYEAPSIIGDILYPKSSRGIPRHDWALFDAAKLGLKYFMANQPTFAIAKESELPKQDTLVNIWTSRGEVTGTLSSSTSGILLNPAQGFVHVRMIIMERGSSLLNFFLVAFLIRRPHEYSYWNRLGHYKGRLRCMGCPRGSWQDLRTYYCNE